MNKQRSPRSMRPSVANKRKRIQQLLTSTRSTTKRKDSKCNHTSPKRLKRNDSTTKSSMNASIERFTTDLSRKMKETGKAPPKNLEEIEKDLDLGMHYEITLIRGVPSCWASIFREADRQVWAFLQKRINCAPNKSFCQTNLLSTSLRQSPLLKTSSKTALPSLRAISCRRLKWVGPQRINFKNRFDKSHAKKSFVVTNDLR